MEIYHRDRLEEYRKLKGQWYKVAVNAFDTMPDVNTVIVSGYAPSTNGYKWADTYETQELVQGQGLVTVTKYFGDIYYYKKYRKGLNVRTGRVVKNEKVPTRRQLQSGASAKV